MREITLTVRGDTVHANRHRAGIQGECNATALVVSFDESWDGYAKKITFWDALEQNPVVLSLGWNKLADSTKDLRTYQTTIPGEPLKEAGECTLVIEGYKEENPDVIAKAMTVRLTVEASPTADKDVEPAEPTNDQYTQLRAEIEAIIRDIRVAQSIQTEVQEIAVEVGQSASNAALSEQAAAEHKEAAERAAALAEGYTSHPPVIGENGNWWEWDGEVYVDTGKPSRGEQGPQGIQGERGPSGYVLTQEDKQDIVTAVLEALPAAEEVAY